MTDKTPTYHVEITQMLYIAGETTEPSLSTTLLIEHIVQEQVIEILKQASALATRRGSRIISNEDIIFVVRHDGAKVSRLRTFLAWKDVRKNLKDDDDKGGMDPDAETVDEVTTTTTAATKKSRKKTALPWDVSSFFSVQPPDLGNEEDEDEDLDDAETRRRLLVADERTRDMTREQYAVWAENRQASFTWRKSKRFREWSRLSEVHDGGRVGDDVIDILGFLTAEIVKKLGEEARRVLDEEERDLNTNKRLREGKKKREKGLFEAKEEERRSIEIRHVREAYRRLQVPGMRMRAFEGLGPRGLIGGKRVELI